MQRDELPWVDTETARILAETAGAAAASPIRVLPADSRPVPLRGLVQLIERQRPQMELVGQAASYAHALYLAESHQPDVVLLSLCQDPLDALEAVSALKRLCRGKVLLLKSKNDLLPMSRLLRMGAAGVAIEEAGDAIVKAIHQVHQLPGPDQKHWFSRILTAGVRASGPVHRGSADALSRLTSRERELIKVMVANPGAKYFAIGAQLGISEHTVHNHLTNIYQKLNLVTRSDLLVYAVRNGLDAGDGIEPFRGSRPVN